MGPIVHRRDNTSAYIIGGVMLAILAFSAIARAKTFHEKEPGNKTTIVKALAQAKSGKAVFKCRRSKLKEGSGRWSGTKGSKYTWHLAVGPNEPSAADKMEQGGIGYVCDPQEYDADARKFSRLEEVE